MFVRVYKNYMCFCLLYFLIYVFTHFCHLLQTRGEDPLTNEEIDELFRDVDQDGDSDTLNRRELVAILTQKY